MNDQVREAVREAMKERGLSHNEVAQLLGVERPNVTRMLSGGSGKVPEVWQRVFDLLGLELVAVKKNSG